MTRRLFASIVVPLLALVPTVHAHESSPGGPPVHDSPIWVFVLADQLEHAFVDGRDALRLNALSWIGGDYNRLWLYAEGEMNYGSGPEDADAQALYGRLIAPFWDLQAGVRYARPLEDGPARGSAVVALQGLARYWFETQLALFLSHKGEVSGRVEAEYDLLFTQRLIGQPRLHSNVAVQRVEELGVAPGINDVELGFRLRYELMRELAPYAGVSWRRALLGTADLARQRGADVEELSVVTGVRLWY